MTTLTTHRLRPVPPFDFAQTLGFLGAFAPTGGEQTLSVQSLTKAVRVHGQTVGFDLRSVGTVEARELTCDLFSDHPLPPGVEEAALDRVRFFLSLDDDLGPFYALAPGLRPLTSAPERRRSVAPARSPARIEPSRVMSVLRSLGASSVRRASSVALTNGTPSSRVTAPPASGSIRRSA